MIRTSFLTRPADALALGLATVAGAGLIANPASAAEKKDKNAPAAAPAAPAATSNDLASRITTRAHSRSNS